MTPRRIITFGATALVAVATVTIFTGPASARPPAQTAACQYRVCVLLLPHTPDSDGDGVADVDEVFLGTNGRDPASRPEPNRLIDVAISRQLPSWENHLSELVVLPQLTPDHHAVATGLGSFGIASNPGELMRTVGAGLNGLNRNGFGDAFGVSVALPSQQGDLSPAGRTQMGFAGRMALVADGTAVNGVVGDSNYGVNGGLRATSVTGGKGTAGADGGGRVQEFGYEGGGKTAIHTYSVGYSDGSRDDVQTTRSESTTVTTVSSYDEKGAHVADTTVVTTSGEDSSGATTSSVSVTTMLYDEKNNPTGGSQTTTETKTSGTTTTTTVTDQELDANGKPTGDATVTTTTTECTSSPCPGATEEDFTDPDYVATGPITDADVARVITRLNDSRRPGPDTGDSTPTGPPPSGGRWPLVALIAADGVTVIAVGNVPAFNPMQPDYDPRLAALAGISGFPPPSTRDGQTTWQ